MLPVARLIRGSSTANVAVLTVVVSPDTVKLPEIVTLLGNPTVNVPELSETSTSFVVPWITTVPPNEAAVELEPSPNVIEELLNDELPMFDNVLSAPLIVLLVSVWVAANPAKLSDCRAELNSDKLPVNVLFAKSIDLLVNVEAWASKVNWSLPVNNGRVTVLSAANSDTATTYWWFADVSLNCGVVNTGLVKVLLVKVCEPVKVATVESIASVTVVPVALESNPVPPAIVNVSESKSTSIVPESDVMSISCAVNCESTYALIDCWVASCVALSEAMLSSSSIAEPETAVFNTALVNVLFVSVAELSFNTNVPVALGNDIVLSAVGSTVVNVVSCASSVAPSNTKAFWILTVVESTVVVVPETVKFPEIVTLSSNVIVPPAESIVRFPEDVSISPAAVLPNWIFPCKLPTVAAPPAVEPSCSNTLFKVVSTVISPAAPV